MILTLSEIKKIYLAIGVIAREGDFSTRDLDKYTGLFTKSFVHRAVDRGYLDVVALNPLKYAPTKLGWSRITSEEESKWRNG